MHFLSTVQIHLATKQNKSDRRGIKHFCSIQDNNPNNSKVVTVTLFADGGIIVVDYFPITAPHTQGASFLTYCNTLNQLKTLTF